MANTISWDYPQIDTAPTEDGLTDVAKTIHWRVTAVSDSETNADGEALAVSAYGTAAAGEVNADTFVAFDSLTKDWCKARVLACLEKTEAELQEMLSGQINSIANPPVVGKVPAGW
tara:strand:+ start:73 stop:420 length:348 start_codon:yes stop_codon:yes gene_type:complete